MNTKNSPSLCISLGRLELKNPIMVASGTFGYAREMQGIIDVPRCARLHAEIAQAVSERDSEAASRHLSALLDYIEQMTHASVSSRVGAESDFAVSGS